MAPQVLHMNRIKFPKGILLHCSVYQHGRRDVRGKPSLVKATNIGGRKEGAKRDFKIYNGDVAEKVTFVNYYMALSHKDWELPNSRVCLAEIDIDRGLDFPTQTGI